MEIEQLNKQIEETSNKLDKLKSERYKLECDKLLSEMSSYVGKCFEVYNSGYDTRLVYIHEADAKNKRFKITDINYYQMLIGDHCFNVCLKKIDYRTICQENWKEISKEEYQEKASQIIKFGLSELTLVTGITLITV